MTNGHDYETPSVPLARTEEQRLLRDGWAKGRPPADRQDRVAPRCRAHLAGRRCIRVGDHLERPVPVPHCLVYAPSGLEPWWKELWGAGA